VEWDLITRAESRLLIIIAEKRDLVKVATFNINNINKRLDNLLAWLAKAEPDVVSLQELKAEQEVFPVNALRALGYEAVWQGERSWNGVAILARNHVPVLTCTSLPGNPEDHQARYIEAAVLREARSRCLATVVFMWGWIVIFCLSLVSATVARCFHLQPGWKPMRKSSRTVAVFSATV
jgi:endonuclease/exonuclease/phosphatase (EEP) superfamily protein YafD